MNDGDLESDGFQIIDDLHVVICAQGDSYVLMWKKNGLFQTIQQSEVSDIMQWLSVWLPEDTGNKYEREDNS